MSLNRPSNQEIKEFLQSISVVYESTDLPNLSVFHGTTVDQFLNVKSGPRNIGKSTNLAGKGLYVAKDIKLAKQYADMKGDLYLKEERGILMQGNINPHKKYRVAHLTLIGPCDPETWTKGKLRANWTTKYPWMEELVYKNFDILIVESKHLVSTKFFVVTERAGADAVLWQKLYEKNMPLGIKPHQGTFLTNKMANLPKQEINADFWKSRKVVPQTKNIEVNKPFKIFDIKNVSGHQLQATGNTILTGALKTWKFCREYNNNNEHGFIRNSWNASANIAVDAIVYKPFFLIFQGYSVPIMLLSETPDLTPQIEEATRKAFSSRPSTVGGRLQESDDMERMFDLAIANGWRTVSRAIQKPFVDLSHGIKEKLIEHGYIDPPKSRKVVEDDRSEVVLETNHTSYNYVPIYNYQQSLLIQDSLAVPTEPKIQAPAPKVQFSPEPVYKKASGSYNTSYTFSQLHNEHVTFRNEAIKDRDKHLHLNQMTSKVNRTQCERSLAEVSWEELGPDRIDKLVISDSASYQYISVPSYNYGHIDNNDLSLDSLNLEERPDDDPSLLHANVENKAKPLKYANNTIPYQTSRPHHKTPDRLVEGLAVSASMAGGVIALKLKLCMLTGAVGVGFVIGLELFFSWQRKKEKRELKRKTRNALRGFEQCNYIEKELNFANSQVENALKLFNEYMFETNPKEKLIKRELLDKALKEAVTHNSAREGWTDTWANNEKAKIKIGDHHSHKLRDEAKDYAKSILKEKDYQHNNEVLQECYKYLEFDDANVNTLITKMHTETGENRRLYICYRISELLRNAYSKEEMQFLVDSSRNLFKEQPNNDENKIIHTETLIRAGKFALGNGSFSEAKLLFSETLSLNKNHIEAKCGLLLADIHESRPMDELLKSASELQTELKNSLHGKNVNELNGAELELYILNSENIKRTVAKLNDHTVNQYANLLNDGKFELAKNLLSQNPNLEESDKIECLVLQARAEVRTSHGGEAIESCRLLLAQDPNNLSYQSALLLAEAQSDKPIDYLQQKLTELKNNLNGKSTPALTADLEKITTYINNKTIVQFDGLVKEEKFEEANHLILHSHLSPQIKERMHCHVKDAKNIIAKNGKQRQLDLANEKLAAKNFTGAIAAYDEILAMDANNFLAKCGKLMAEICIIEKPELALSKLFENIKKLETELKSTELSLLDRAKYKVNLDKIKESFETLTMIRKFQLLRNYDFDAAFDLVSESVLEADVILSELKEIKELKVNYYVSNSLQLAEHLLKLFFAAQSLYQLWLAPKSKLYAPVVPLKKPEFIPFWERQSLPVNIVSPAKPKRLSSLEVKANTPVVAIAPPQLQIWNVREIKPETNSGGVKPISIKPTKYF